MDYTFDDMLEGVKHIRETFEDVKFDYVVGIARGGVIPGVILSHQLKVPFVALHWQTRDVENQEHNAWMCDYAHEGKQILLVDDICDSGKTFRGILRDWDAHELANVKLSCLIFNKGVDLIHPVIYHKTIDRDTNVDWVNFWWEK